MARGANYLDSVQRVGGTRIGRYEKPMGMPKPGEPIPEDWFDEGRRRRINEFRRELPA